MYKVKRLDDGIWYVLVANAEKAWVKIAETGYQTTEEAEQALCRQLDADAQRERLNFAEGNQSR